MISNKNIFKLNHILKEIEILEQRQIYLLSFKLLSCYYSEYQDEIILNNNLIRILKLKAKNLYITNK